MTEDTSSLVALKTMLQKSVKGIHTSILADSEIAAVKDYFPTPAYDLNRILTGSLFKGLGSKTFTLLVGPEASFKSSFMCLCAAEAQRQGYTPYIIDTEGAWTAEFVGRWGLDGSKCLYTYTPWVDDIMVALGKVIDMKPEKLCIIIDSIGGLETYKMIEDATKGDVKADQGQLTRKIKRLMKMILNIAKNQNSIALASAHLYANVSGYGESDLVGGGKFVKLGPDTIIQLAKSKMLDNEKNVIGNLIKATTIKNRFYPAYSEAVVEIDYANGVNKLAGMTGLAMKAGLITQAGAWYTNTISGEKFQGEANVEKAITQEMLVKLDEWISKTGYSTVNNEVAKVMEEIGKMSEEAIEIAIAEDKPESGRRSLRRS